MGEDKHRALLTEAEVQKRIEKAALSLKYVDTVEAEKGKEKGRWARQSPHSPLVLLRVGFAFGRLQFCDLLVDELELPLERGGLRFQGFDVIDRDHGARTHDNHEQAENRQYAPATPAPRSLGVLKLGTSDSKCPLKMRMKRLTLRPELDGLKARDGLNDAFTFEPKCRLRNEGALD